MDDDPLAPALESLGDELLIVTAAVASRSIDKIDAEIESLVQCSDGFIVIRRPIHPRHTHAAESHSRNLELTCAKLYIFHGSSSNNPFTKRSHLFWLST